MLANTDVVASGSGNGVVKLWCAALTRSNPTFDTEDAAQMGLTSINQVPLVRDWLLACPTKCRDTRAKARASSRLRFVCVTRVV